MNGYTQPTITPPPPARMGCFTKGCLILVCFILFLIVAGGVGLYLGFRHNPGVMKGVLWASQTHLLADSPSPVPAYQTTDQEIAVSKEKWKAFEHAKKQEPTTPSRVELSASDINNLIAGSDARGKAFVSIEGNQLRVQTSVPLGDYLGKIGGGYLNGDIVVESSGPYSLEHPNLATIKVNGHPVPSDLLNWQFKSRSVRDYVGHYQGKVDVNSVEIRDGKLILERQPRS